jgi:hypothetical protein
LAPTITSSILGRALYSNTAPLEVFFQLTKKGFDEVLMTDDFGQPNQSLRFSGLKKIDCFFEA